MSFVDELQLRLFHLEAGVWVDRTVSLDTAARRICADVASLSPFAVFEPHLTALFSDRSRTVRVGSRFTVRMTVKNTGPQTVTITPSALLAEGSGSVALVGGPSPSSATVRPGRTKVITWRYRAVESGTVRFSGHVSGPEAAPPVARGNPVTIR